MIGPGHIECIELLLAAGADPREARGDGTTALMWASEDGNLRAIELLLAAGARPHQRRDDGSDALMLALRNLKRDPAAALALAALAQPLRTPRRDGRDDLMCAARGGMPECVAWALSRGGDASARDKDGNTALHFAAVSGSRKAVEMLVAAGARIDALNQKGFSPMRGGANGLDPDAFEALALAGADPLLHDGTPNASPFFQACARGWFDQIDICLDRGLKRRLESGEGERICELAEQAHPCGSRVRDYVNYLTSRDEKAALLAETPNQPDPKPRAILRV
jgi:ankyrin repeat protein